ncbi:MAG: hypothetical protein ACRDN8_10835 [Thermoleophilaceae bacterium]
MHRVRRAIAVLGVTLVAALGVGAGPVTEQADAYAEQWIRDYRYEWACRVDGNALVWSWTWKPGHGFADSYRCDRFLFRGPRPEYWYSLILIWH